MRVLGLLLALAISICAVSGVVLAQPANPPGWVASSWQEPQDTTMALQSPDEYAWRLFVALNWPARAGAREADPAKRLGDPGRVVWESWKLVSGGRDKSEVYRAGGADPTDWTAPLDPYCDATARDLFPLQNMLRQGGDLTTFFEPGAATPGVDEVRMNFGTFDFIKKNNLFFTEGQEALFKNGTATIKFPPAAKEIKAQWREIADADESRYHACRSGGKLYGLTALHILTKDLPNWFWATFEHIDNKKPENLSKPGYGPWLLTSVDAFSCPAGHLDCEEAPKAIGLEGTKWQNYRLRGTQIDFVDSTGAKTRLANSQVETDFQTSSSCITCHARASIGERIGNSVGGNRLSIFDPPATKEQILTPYGAPDPGLFASSAGGTSLRPTKILRYTQLDFIWSFIRAQRRQP
jgi:hypothetical protein